MEILKKIYSGAIDIMQTFLMAASIFLVIYIFIMRPFQVSGESMFPTFKDKEYILTNRVILRFDSPHRGDVIVFKAPVDTDKDFIKRVLGEPGDMISVKEGFIYVNGSVLLENAYLGSDVRTYGGSFLKEGVPVVVPQDSYFVAGDNRSHSSDSREWGFLPKKNLEGISFLVYWPVNAVRIVKNPFASVNK